MEEPFPETLEGFGYGFNNCGQLRKIDQSTGTPGKDPFEFTVLPHNQHFNQRHYEALGEVVTNHVYKLLETRGNLKKHFLKCKDEGEGDSNKLESFVFVSDDLTTNTEKVMILIHGSGVVRAGQWTRR